MELTSGYKQTEVGMIPKEWESVKAGEVGRFRGGNGFPRRFQGAISGDYPFYKVSDMNNEGNETFMFDSNNWISEGVRKQLGATAFPAYSIIFAKVGAAIFLERKKILAKPSCIDNNLAALVLDSARADVRFVHYCLLNIKFGGLVSTTALPSLGGSVLSQIAFSLPSLPEQRAIAGALGDVDALLGALTQLIAKKRELKQAAMQQLLTGQTHLPGFSGEWKVKPLVSFVKCERFAIVDGPFGSQMKVDEFVPSGVPVIEMEHLKDGFIDKRIERCITPKKFEELKRSAVFPGDIVISKTGSLGYLGIIPESIEKGLITSRLAKISLDPSCADRMFIFQYLLKLRTDGYWEKVSQGGTMQILGIRMLQNAPIPDISVAEQGAIATVLSDMDVELAALEHRLAKARALKHGMMQELLTGRTRLV